MMRLSYFQFTAALCGVGLLVGCETERPPRSTAEFIENPIMLEAAMVRCSQDRSKTRYDAECVNARLAVSQIEAKEEARRKAEFEVRSETKRQQLRKTQEAAAQARRQAAEQERLRKEAEYLAQFGVAPPPENANAAEEEIGNLPVAVIPEASPQDAILSGPGPAQDATDGGNAPAISSEPEQEDAPRDLESIRDELQRRNADGEG